MIELGSHVYYQDCFGFWDDGVIVNIFEDGSFTATAQPYNRMPQMDDSRRILRPYEEGVLFCFSKEALNAILQKKIREVNDIKKYLARNEYGKVYRCRRSYF